MRRTKAAETRLERFLKQHGIRPSDLDREIHITRKHLFDIRMGRVEPGQASIATILHGVRKLTGTTSITVEQLFDLSAGRRKAS